MAGKRPPRSPYTPEDRQRALTALYASGDEVDGEWIPNATAVSRLEGMPTVATLMAWWRARDRGQDSTHLKTAQRVREQARQQGGQQFFDALGESLKEGVSWVVSEEHRGMRTIFDKDGNCLGEDYKVRPDHMSRAYKDAAQTAEKMRDLWGIGKAPEQTDTTATPEEAEAAIVKTLLQRPDLMVEVLRTNPGLLPLLQSQLNREE